MKRKFRLLAITIFVIALSLIAARFLLLAQIQDKLELLSDYCQREGIERGLIASQKGDGSEPLVRDLPVEIRTDVEVLSRCLKIYSGMESRVYLTMYREAGTGLVIHVETSREWRNSLFFYNEVDWIFSNDKKYLSELMESGKITSFYGKIGKKNICTDPR